MLAILDHHWGPSVARQAASAREGSRREVAADEKRLEAPAAGEVAPPPGGGVEKKRRAILRGDIEERLQEGEDTPESYHGERWLAAGR